METESPSTIISYQAKVHLRYCYNNANKQSMHINLYLFEESLSKVVKYHYEFCFHDQGILLSKCLFHPGE